MPADFESLVAEGAAAPLKGWDFSWFEGRATEERPPWGYARRLAGRLGTARAALDIQTGGGEVLAESPRRPPLLVATESFAPNVALAHRALRPLGAWVVTAGDDAGLPFRTDSFDLVASRHPTVTVWAEIARVLQPGGAYLSQQVGVGSVRELTDFMMGPQPVSDARSVSRAVTAATRAGLVVVDVREATLRTVFYDVAAVTPTCTMPLDRARLHGRALSPAARRAPRVDPDRRLLRRARAAVPHRGPEAHPSGANMTG